MIPTIGVILLFLSLVMPGDGQVFNHAIAYIFIYIFCIFLQINYILKKRKNSKGLNDSIFAILVAIVAMIGLVYTIVSLPEKKHEQREFNDAIETIQTNHEAQK